MKLEKWALIAEIVGALAIVITLVFLIVEIRANSAAIRASTATSISDRTQTLLLTNMSNAELMEASLKEARGEVLSESEEALLNVRQAANLKLAEESFIAFRDGNLDPEIWQTRVKNALDIVLVGEQGRRRWDARRDSGWYVQDFVDFIDAELARRDSE